MDVDKCFSSAQIAHFCIALVSSNGIYEHGEDIEGSK
jgi:hypothetical protein